MSRPPSVLELRLSFVWTETFSTLLSGAAPMAFLGNHEAFTNQYNIIRREIQSWQARSEQLRAKYAGDSQMLAAKTHDLNMEFEGKLGAPERLTLPWRWLGRNHIHHFWQYYFKNVEPNNLTGTQAWEYLVPLRINMPHKIGSPWPPDGPRCRIMIDGLFYPHGVAAVITARLLFNRQPDGATAKPDNAERGLGLARTMDHALEIRKGLTFPITLPNHTNDKLKLDALAAKLLNYLRAKASGKNAPQGDRPGEPLTVATVIQGYVGDALPIASKSELHRTLEGLCSWRDDWALQENLKPIDKVSLLIGNPPPGHVLYHTKRGRAVWMPQYFALIASRDMHKLSCYHRNLTLVSLQTEMLAQLCQLYTGYLEQGKAEPPELKLLTRFAAIRLGLLYGSPKKGSVKHTYNSASPRFYLDENDYVDTVNKARGALKLELQHLVYKPW